MSTTNNETIVGARAEHKVTYEWRSLLGIIGSWKEIQSIAVSKPEIHIATTRDDYSGVYINGKEYVLKETPRE